MTYTTQHAANDLAATIRWLRSPQAAVMAQLSEQIAGAQAGLIPGDSDTEKLGSWIDSRYGNLPDPVGLEEVNPVARLAGKIRQWQATRLEKSALVFVSREVTVAAERLTTTGAFRNTPSLGEDFPPVVTVVWNPDHAAHSMHASVGPGHLPGEDRACAITVDSMHNRIIEWTPTRSIDLDSRTAHLASVGDVSLPPWLPAGDEPYIPEEDSLQRLRARLIAAGKSSLASEAGCLVEQANAVLVGVRAGLFKTVSHSAGVEVVPPV